MDNFRARKAPAANMLRILLLSLLAAFALSEPRYLEDLDIDKRVVGGEEAKPNSWPWQISLQSLDGSYYRHDCGGSLIRPGWVMTAAHCVDTTCFLCTSRKWRVVLGDHDITIDEGHEQYISVSCVYIHPNWDRNSLSSGYDIALLRLSTDATLNSYVKLATLPPSGQVLPHNNPCYITGWGYTSSIGPESAVLKQASLPVVDYSNCSRSDWWGSYVKNNMVCAGGRNESGCFGDSGGPLNCLVSDEYVVHGVTSFGSGGCNIYKKPTVFTRVSAYISWINDIIG